MQKNNVFAIPELSLVLMVGPSGAGKSTFARKHFLGPEVVSSDTCRGIVCNNEMLMEANGDAFDLVNYIIGKRLKRGLLTVVDATNVQAGARKSLLKLAQDYHVIPVAIVLDMPEDLCVDRNTRRPERPNSTDYVRRQAQDLRKSFVALKTEGFSYIHVLSSPEEVAGFTLERTKLWTNKKDDRGPFDLIGDVHGCYDELVRLLQKLGYDPRAGGAKHPAGRRVVFLGDFVDRGPRIADTIRLVMAMTTEGRAYCLPGNHETKLLKKLQGRDVRISHGLEQTLNELGRETPAFIDGVRTFIDGLVSHYVFDGGRLAAAHAGLSERLLGRASRAVSDFALYGETTGESDAFGLPVRHQWTAEYRGKAAMVYGHTPVPAPEWINNTICVDTGCVYGGNLTALRWPEKELVSVPAARAYFKSL